jgi:4-amino-4-deoxy-L-arabinose transferase-like glycosyltransferase
MRSRLQREIDEHPLRLLLVVGLALRLVAAFCARGYMATDDHNQVIELAASWLRGNNDYLAGDSQFYRSLLYPALNYLQIAACHSFGIVHPDHVMLINRLLHAAFSLWTIALTYRLGLRLGGKSVAWTAGLIVAAHALMPYVSVRNLIEAVCIPFLLWGICEIVNAQDDRSDRNRHWLLAGLAFGIGFLIRWQIASAIAGIGVYLLIKRKWRGAFLMSLAFLVPVAVEGYWDWQAHGVFLGSLVRYLQHNAIHAYDYVVGPWYRYLLLVLGIFVPPFSVLCLYASGRYIKRLGIIAWAVLPFFIVHSLVPGKQERFLIPIFPEIALMFVLALWHWRRECSAVLDRWIGYGWRWFWAVNAVLLIGALTHYGQRGKIEPLIGLFEEPQVSGVFVDVSVRGRKTDLPLFYLDGGGVRPMPQIVQCTDMNEMYTQLGTSSAWSHIVYFGTPVLGPDMLPDRYGQYLNVVRHTSPTLIERALLKLNPKYTHSRESWLCRIVQP